MTYPIKMSFRTEWKICFLMICSIISGLYFYAHFPAIIASHWNYLGQPNGYMGKFWGAFLSTAFLIGIYLLFIIIPVIDPQKEKYHSFQRSFLAIRDIVSLFLFLIFLEIGLYNLGYAVNISLFTPIFVGILLFLIGRYIKSVKKNWFVGVRTPWTLSSDVVWVKTNNLAGILFQVIGAITIIFALLDSKDSIWFMAIAIIATAVFLTIYSYMEFQKEQKNNN